MEEIRIGDLRIAYQSRGAGPPLMLLHGGLSDSREWRRQLEDLSDTFTVVAWDAPGCGSSSDPPETYRLPDYADCLAVFLEELGIAHPHLLGISFGAGLALEFYRRHPETPRTLVLASAYAGWAGSLPREEVEDRLERGLEQSRQPLAQVAEEFIPTLFSKPVPAEVIRETTAIISEAHPVGMRVMLRSFAEADLRDVLPSINIPVLLLHGELDQRSPMSVARELHARIPESSLVVIPDTGHAGNLESPEAFSAEVRKFL